MDSLLPPLLSLLLSKPLVRQLLSLALPPFRGLVRAKAPLGAVTVLLVDLLPVLVELLGIVEVDVALDSRVLQEK